MTQPTRGSSDALTAASPTRREWIKGLGIGTIAYVLGKASQIESDIEGFGKLVHRVGLARDRFLDEAGFEAQRLSTLNKLFDLPGRVLLHPGDSHLAKLASAADQTTSYLPHDQAAVVPFTTLFGNAETLDSDSPIEEALGANDSLICSGSPVSNSFTRSYLPRHWVDAAESAGPPLLNPTRIPYHFLHGSRRSKVFVVSGMEGGRAVEKRVNGLLIPEASKSDRLWYPPASTDRQGWLKTDFLLVSRLPRNVAGGEVLILSGAHGPSTQAVELLFTATGIPLEELVDCHA